MNYITKFIFLDEINFVLDKFIALNAYVRSDVLNLQVSRAVSGLSLEVISGTLTQPSVVETRSTGKKELPEVVILLYIIVFYLM